MYLSRVESRDTENAGLALIAHHAFVLLPSSTAFIFHTFRHSSLTTSFHHPHFSSHSFTLQRVDCHRQLTFVLGRLPIIRHRCDRRPGAIWATLVAEKVDSSKALG